jgi:hypothetical protein
MTATPEDTRVICQHCPEVLAWLPADSRWYDMEGNATCDADKLLLHSPMPDGLRGSSSV